MSEVCQREGCEGAATESIVFTYDRMAAAAGGEIIYYVNAQVPIDLCLEHATEAEGRDVIAGAERELGMKRTYALKPIGFEEAS